MDDVVGDTFGSRLNEMDYHPAVPVHDPFMNGSTQYDEDGQRYLLFNEICGVIVRKQNVSTNPMEMNNIMSSLNNRKYVYELGMINGFCLKSVIYLVPSNYFRNCKFE